MYIAVDDTDSMRGNCTTFLATEIIRELYTDFDLIGNPRLVRLNPAVPWKTRGNGSLILKFGKGVGKKTRIGIIDGKDIFCFENGVDISYEKKDIVDRIKPLIEKFHESDADPGLIVSDVRPSPEYYEHGLFTIMSVSDVVDELDRIGAETFTIGNGRGLIGSICGLAWIPRDFTYELLTYRIPDKWGTPRHVDSKSIMMMDHQYPSTFNSWEDRTNKVAMVPATPCPVLYGLRGDSMDDLIPASESIESEEIYRWVIFLTNQGTDDHIIREYESLRPNASYLVKGVVRECARHIRGGHVFMDMDTEYGVITCGAYEPSKEFRMVFDRLIPGDTIEVMGEYREDPATLNVEKLHVISLVPDLIKVSNPMCQVCGKRMESVGKGQGYRCRKCHTRSDSNITTERMRWIVPGWYEPPTAARRHLSKPLKRMGLEQPVEFVICRN